MRRWNQLQWFCLLFNASQSDVSFCRSRWNSRRSTAGSRAYTQTDIEGTGFSFKLLLQTRNTLTGSVSCGRCRSGTSCWVSCWKHERTVGCIIRLVSMRDKWKLSWWEFIWFLWAEYKCHVWLSVLYELYWIKTGKDGGLRKNVPTLMERRGDVENESGCFHFQELRSADEDLCFPPNIDFSGPRR